MDRTGFCFSIGLLIFIAFIAIYLRYRTIKDDKIEAKKEKDILANFIINSLSKEKNNGDD